MSGASVSHPIFPDPSLTTEPLRIGVHPVGERIGPALRQRFVAYLDARLPQPTRWSASAQSVEYLNLIDGGETYVTEKGGNRSLVFVYSGSAGTGQTAADLLAHWTNVWLEAEREALTRDILAPAGLQLAERSEADTFSSRFVPCGEYGYGNLYRGPTDDEDHFALDFEQIIDEMLGDPEAEEYSRHPFIEELHERALTLTEGTRCLCQLCAKSFEPDRVLEGLEPPDLG